MYLEEDSSIEERLYAQELGWKVLDYIKKCNLYELPAQVDSDALTVIEEIKAVLDDLTLDEPTCFLRIDMIVKIFYYNNLKTERHWELK